jgi:phosphatidylglycerophosphatase A
VLLATAGGLGYVPVAPGTIGSLAAVPLLPALAALRARSAPLCAGVLLLLIAVAVWAAGCAEEAFASADHPRIVVDEVAGLALAGLFLPATWAAAGLAFVLFRAFDVLKPFPAGWIDRRLHGGIGVVGDDLVAGLYAGVASRLLIGVP